jgi:large subunit ribosomal protein L13
METSEEQTSTVIDASGLILGRMASIVAKRLLSEESITIVNAEKTAISGKRLSRVKEARAFLEIGHPKKGPFHPRRPDRIVHKTIRGMLPHRQPKGNMALKRLQVFLGMPDEFKNAPVKSIPEAHVSKLKGSYLTLGELAKEIGYKQVGE